MYYFHIIYSVFIDRYYVGHTSDLESRLIKHNEGTTAFTSRACHWEIIYIEEYTEGEAMKREIQIKKMKSRKYIQNLTGH
ncbi:MAG: GIY-YIG nuclease family protein [Ignavibacteriaceae bacterium]|nr:GIY-YIG nuclease family protein [Ignavibacteriaceae bacterium]NUM72511.1 GIY-YIG nuclease family protein [Ignavibacteriaceae bacterium]